jgi:methylamine dehydrogenase light chain
MTVDHRPSSARPLAGRTSRRSFLTRVGTLLVGAAALPLLPVARALDRTPAPDDGKLSGELADPKQCGYWRHCAIDGFLCACCGGSQNSCPPGTEMSPITWIGTCRNPGDGKDHIIRTTTAGGRSSAAAAAVSALRARPVYYTSKNNDPSVSTKSRAVTCSSPSSPAPRTRSRRCTRGAALLWLLAVVWRRRSPAVDYALNRQAANAPVRQVACRRSRGASAVHARPGSARTRQVPVATSPPDDAALAAVPN